MSLIKIPATEITPFIILDKENGVFQIAGKCLPEDVKSFFNPVIEWFEDYLQNPNDETVIELDFEYFNTASSKMILIICLLFFLITLFILQKTSFSPSKANTLCFLESIFFIFILILG